MTTTPIGSLFAGLVPGAVVGPVPAPATGAAGDAFLALVQELLGGTPDEAAEGTPDKATDRPLGQPVTGGAPRQIEDAPALVPEVADVDTDVVPVPPPAVTAAVAAVVAPLAPPPAASVTPAVEQPTITAATTEAAAPAPTPAPAPGPTALTVERPDVAVPAAAAPSAPSPEPATSTPATSTPNTPATPVAAAPPPSPTAVPVATVPPGDTHRVTQLVFPEVVRVATSPDGPQRVTVRLQPESLGEVRVVLTSRRGGLEVSITAGTEARTALVEGAPELQRLLESVGRGDSRIVVRDLTGTPTDPSGGSTGGGTSTGAGTGRPGGDAGPGHPRHHGPGSNTATEGTPATTTPSRPTESVTRARTGLDVTM